MAIEISIKHKVHPQGALIELVGVCAVPNGGSVVLDAVSEGRFKKRFPDGLPEKSVFKAKNVKGKAVDPNEAQDNVENAPDDNETLTTLEGGETQ